MFNIAYAMPANPGGGTQPGGMMSIVPFILMFVIFYFLLIRPQQKKHKEHQQMVSSLKKGDKVITSGGIHGVITKVDDTDVQIEIADKVKIKVVRANISVKI